MDEWADGEGNTLAATDKASFQYSMEQALFNPLGALTVPANQRNFATRTNLPTYPNKIADLRAQGAKLVLVYGIGRMCHIAFWEPHFAAEFHSAAEWKRQTHRLGAKLHPLTIEQNAITSFKSRTTLVPARANTIGPGLFSAGGIMPLAAVTARCRAACSGRGLSFWATLRYGPDMWIPSTFMPTLPGKLFFDQELAGPLLPECN